MKFFKCRLLTECNLSKMAFLLLVTKVKCVESVTLTVANKRDSELNPNLCSKTVECKQSILYQLCPKLPITVCPKIRNPFIWNSGLVRLKFPAVVHPKHRLPFIQNFDQHSNGTPAVHKNIWLIFVWNSGHRLSTALAAVCPKYGDSLSETPADGSSESPADSLSKTLTSFIFNFGRLSKTLAGIRLKFQWPFLQNCGHHLSKTPTTTPFVRTCGSRLSVLIVLRQIPA